MPQVDGRSAVPARVEREIEDELVVGDRTIRRIARVAGWSGSGGRNGSTSAGAVLKVTPVRVVVGDSDGAERDVAFVDPTQQALRGMMVSAIVLAALSSLAILVAGRFRARQ